MFDLISPEPAFCQLTKEHRICKACFSARVRAGTNWVQTHDLIDIVLPEACEADEHDDPGGPRRCAACGCRPP